MKDNSIYSNEDELHGNLRQSYSEKEREKIVDDGLCWAAISNRQPDKNNNNWPECLWTESSRRVLFLLKEPNGNEGEDYKDWDWSKGSESFGNILAYWLYGLMTTSDQYCPTYDDIANRDEIFKEYPLAIVNSKKIAGGSSSNWNEIWKYAKRDGKFLRKQIREILKPNIIVCGGSNDADDKYRKVLSIAMDIIYPDIKMGFTRIDNNNWCYYNSKEDILLIDSYHPSCIMKERDKIEGLINAFHDFIVKTGYRN